MTTQNAQDLLKFGDFASFLQNPLDDNSTNAGLPTFSRCRVKKLQ